MSGDFVAFCSIDRRLETGVFQVAQTHRIACTKHAQAVGVFFRLSETESEAAEQLFADVVKLLPSFERFVGYASIDENQRNVLRLMPESMAGQRSDSNHRTRSGRQWRMKRVVKTGLSIGIY